MTEAALPGVINGIGPAAAVAGADRTVTPLKEQMMQTETKNPHDPISKEHTMRGTSTAGVLEHQPVSARIKLAAAWTSFMFLYIYVDYLTLYTPGVIEDILNGVVWKLEITQTFVVGALTLMAIPIFMVVLSTTLPARACRLTTIVVASIYSLVSIFNVVDESWTYYFGLGVALEVAVLAVIIRTAWTWPRTPRQGSDVEASRPLRTAGAS